jgi:hypothetical protein
MAARLATATIASADTDGRLVLLLAASAVLAVFLALLGAATVPGGPCVLLAAAVRPAGSSWVNPRFSAGVR